MGKHRLGWPDLLLIGGLALALNGFFYAAMVSLAVYAVLYRRAAVRHRRREQAAAPRWEGPLTRENVHQLFDVPEWVTAPRAEWRDEIAPARTPPQVPRPGHDRG